MAESVHTETAMAPRLIANDIRELLPMKRSPGEHVSEIINRLCVALGKWEESVEGQGPPQIQLEVGNCMEDAIADALAARHARDDPGRYIHGLEVEKDGISGNIDLLDTRDFVVEEVKLTKRSIRHDIESEKFWHNWVQVKSYCHMIGSHTGRLHVVFVNGNYKYDDSAESGWQYRVWEDTWTNRELADNWRMLVGHKKQ